MYLFRKLLVWAGLASILTLTAFGQGTAFTYQGKLNAGSNPANGLYDLQFGVYDAATSGNLQGNLITNSATVVSNGLFTVMLDFGNQFPGANRWLEIGARTNGNGAFVTLAPRQEFTATPYSIQSANAASALSAQSVAAGNITGTLAAGQLPSGIVTNGASGVSISGAFTGNGSGLTNVPGTSPWQTVAGTNVTAAANQAYLLTNGSATTVTLPTTANVGDVVTVSGEGSNGWAVLAGPGQVIGRWADNNNAPANSWTSVASSADGAKLAAVGSASQIYTSINSGVTWSANNNSPSSNWTSVASSADGTKLVAAANPGYIYTSTDSGLHWSAAVTNVLGGAYQFWTSVASPADGIHFAAGSVGQQGVYILELLGGTSPEWVDNSPNPILHEGSVPTVTSVASSADGTKVVAAWTGAIYTFGFSGYFSGISILSPGYTIVLGTTNSIVWSSVACSADVTKLVAVDNAGLIYTSTNSGATWSTNNNFLGVSWTSVASSADGARLVAVGGSGIYTSMDSGVTWAKDVAPAAAWASVASSADGAKLVAAVSGGQLWTFDAEFPGTPGETAQFQYVGNGVWQPVGVPASQIIGTLPPGVFTGNGSGLTNVPGTTLWQVVAGTNVTAAANQAYLLTNGSASTVTLPTTANAGDIVTISGDGGSGWQVLSASGQVIAGEYSSPTNWVNNNNAPAANWSSIASSADGTKLVAVVNGGQIYTSSDSGVTWSTNNNAPTSGWMSVASSADGANLVAVNGSQIYTSGDSGSHWSPATNLQAVSVASSADGTKLVAAANSEYIYTSTDSGLHWSAAVTNVLGGASQAWLSVASSADGTKLAATVETTGVAPTGSAIWTSTNSGATWGIGLSLAAGVTVGYAFDSVAFSSNGTKVVAVDEEGNLIATSSNSGATWSTNNNFPGAVWTSVASSADGTRLVAVANGRGIYTSTDSGVTWSTNNNAPVTSWKSVTSSADGTRLAAAVSGGKIWTTVLNPGGIYAGAAGTTAQFQYVGNGVWQPAGVPASQIIGTLSGDGSGLTRLNASQLSSGTVPDARLSANVALHSGPNAFNGNLTVTNGNVGIGTTTPSLNNVEINPTFESANGYGLVVCKTDFGENIEVNETAGGGGIGLVVDDAAAGDDSTDLLLIRNNVASSPQNLMTVGAGGTVGMAGNCFIGGICSAGLFNTTSDRNAKENFQSVSAAQVLAKVSALPIQEWNFKTDTTTRHIGPMAQDFFAAFGVGLDDKHIATVDEDGVALAAIQALNDKSEKAEGRMQKLEDENQKLEEENGELKARLEKLERIIGDQQKDPK